MPLVSSLRKALMSASINGFGINYISGKNVFTVNKETIKIFIYSKILEKERYVILSLSKDVEGCRGDYFFIFTFLITILLSTTEFVLEVIPGIVVWLTTISCKVAF